ncbi:hypothetical protein QTO34_010773 [Cnephaeus nilssonii]|uniref:Uncharacterized protein n=1 Tax=Cnephaeus nilssonii TaxID=3371016 RepID=A0AA40HG84_CNENI|nr:hypothetical protein QTO34_010773 [Eptesicus nilssonii]
MPRCLPGFPQQRLSQLRASRILRHRGGAVEPLSFYLRLGCRVKSLLGAASRLPETLTGQDSTATPWCFVFIFAPPKRKLMFKGAYYIGSAYHSSSRSYVGLFLNSCWMTKKQSFKEQGNAYCAKKDYNEAYNYYIRTTAVEKPR